jgi:hypothetical protein
MLTLLRLPLSPACASLRRDFAGHWWGTKLEADPTWAIATEPAPFLCPAQSGTF